MVIYIYIKPTQSEVNDSEIKHEKKYQNEREVNILN